MFTAGFRNEFDFALDTNGEIFSYDADMDGTSVRMVSPHAHLPRHERRRLWLAQWQWQVAYLLPRQPAAGGGHRAGSPTGMSSAPARIPGDYQRAMFALDWTYGTLWAIHFTPDGASFRGERRSSSRGSRCP